MNDGGIRTGLEAGEVTLHELFEVQPFQNELVLLTLRGETLLAALEHAVDPDGPDAQISGLRAVYVSSAPAGSRIVSVRFDDGTGVEIGKTYSLVVNDFMAGGGSGFEMFREAEATRFTGIVDLDALVDHLRSLPQPVRPPADPRWIPVDREGG